MHRLGNGDDVTRRIEKSLISDFVFLDCRVMVRIKAVKMNHERHLRPCNYRKHMHTGESIFAQHHIYAGFSDETLQ